MSVPQGSGSLPPEAELEARSTFLELLAGFVGALGAGVAGSFASDATVSHYLAAALFGIGCLLWVGVTVLSALTWRRIRALRIGDARAHQHRIGTSWSGWTWIVVVATCVVFLLSVVVFRLGQRPDPDYSSSYDGLDPRLTQCDDSTTKVIAGSAASLKDLQGKRVGSVELKASPACGTTWAYVQINETEKDRLKGQVVHIEMFRPGDGGSEVYPLLLKGGTWGYSNMISAVASCAQANYFLMNQDKEGPPGKTPCRLEQF